MFPWLSTFPALLSDSAGELSDAIPVAGNNIKSWAFATSVTHPTSANISPTHRSANVSPTLDPNTIPIYHLTYQTSKRDNGFTWDYPTLSHFALVVSS